MSSRLKMEVLLLSEERSYFKRKVSYGQRGPTGLALTISRLKDVLRGF